MQLKPLFRPESIAIIGASDKPTPGRRVIATLERLGYAGRIYPVNPNYTNLLNRPCYPSPAELPEAPDIGVFCLGHERVLPAFIAAAERGMKAAVIFDGGFAEYGAEGSALQEKLAAICREHGIALCGPNCMGVLSPHHKSSSYLQELRDPTGLAGNVGIISHSGGLCLSLLTDTRRYGFSHIVSAGNEAAVTAAAYLEYLAEDADTQIIGGFIETIREPERFVAALDRAAALNKPVVLLKVSKSERARRAVITHTAAEAGDPAAISDMLRAHRAIEVDDLVQLTEVLAALQAPKRPKGRRIGIVMSSGGVAELILDVAEATGLQIPPLTPAQKSALETACGLITGDGNPCDAWGSGTFAANLPRALEMFDASPEHDIIVFARDNLDDQPFDMPQTALTYLDLFAQHAQKSVKPHYLLSTRPGIMDRNFVAYLRDRGIAVVGGIREGLGALDLLGRHAT
jgi:acyl-CoA synthetase (NDP forming)